MTPTGMPFLHDSTARQEQKYPPALRFAGHLISVVFHPLFIPSWIAAFLIFKHPYAFISAPFKLKVFRFISVFFSTAFLPAFSVFLLRQLRFIDSIFLRTQKDRIIPYITSMIFYFWIWYVYHNLH
ncbi:MAG: hypothetical protein JST39_24600, partial [Bacteroidetes bacterium]|nr:hypothetical protein [Bacteroidota bacterium]